MLVKCSNFGYCPDNSDGRRNIDMRHGQNLAGRRTVRVWAETVDLRMLQRYVAYCDRAQITHSTNVHLWSRLRARFTPHEREAADLKKAPASEEALSRQSASPRLHHR